MSTGTVDHFGPRGTLTAEQLKAYAEGRLSPAEQHVVELHLENDPLAREAMDGLRVPGAKAGLEALQHARPRDGWSVGSWAVGTVFVAATGLGIWWSMHGTDVGSASLVPMPEEQPSTTVIASAGERIDTAGLTNEIHAAVEIPETLHIGHAPTDRHALPMREAPVARENTAIERLDRRTVAADTITGARTMRPERVKRQSRQLIYLHDLKLVHPQELYPSGPTIIDRRSVTARFVDSTAQRASQQEERMMQYTAFMDAALDKFVRNDHKGCLEELRFVLGQYPDDVNALFYAGLCSYNLGLDERARVLLHRAAVHPVDVFDEEAEWYHALTLERLGDSSGAKEAYAHVVAREGFYAERAQAKLADKVK